MLEKGEASFAFLDEMPRPAAEEMLRRVYPSTPAVGWFSDFSGTGPNFVHQLVFGSRVSDALGVIASEPSGHGCVFNALAAERRALSRSARAMWTRVASHLAIGYRLARQRDVRTEAVLHPSGRLEHAEEVAASRDDRDALSEATRAIDRARGRLRRVDQEEAVAIWTGLVRGRWSLVEQVDHDGKRYLFAKRNPPSVAAWSTLTEAEAQVVAHAAEGQPHKFIAYELGMSLAGVAAHLKRAARKVGARSRLELVSSYIASRPHGAGR
jgi:DNA-binding CsgD family transcriptional regulator